MTAILADSNIGEFTTFSLNITSNDWDNIIASGGIDDSQEFIECVRIPNTPEVEAQILTISGQSIPISCDNLPVSWRDTNLSNRVQLAIPTIFQNLVENILAEQ